ncbi:MAG: flippase-like domain-containing protein, partial [Nitrospinae bacterium]|nr:flippase-like domain-containing protein [Nitrospinota bacterium]
MPLATAKGRAGFWIGVALTVGLVAWALMAYDFSRVWEALKQANYWWVLPAALIEVAVIFIRAVRWRPFLEPIRKVSLYDSSMACYIGFTGNMILPARAGEFIRAWVLARKVKIPATAVMGT